MEQEGLVLESDRREGLLQLLRERPDISLNVALAKNDVTKDVLRRWKRDGEFLARWNEIARSRALVPVKLTRPMVASPAVVKRVLGAFEEDPEPGLVAYCRAAGTTLYQLEAACRADARLGELYQRAKDALTAPVEQLEVQAMLDPKHGGSRRQKYLARHGGDLWGEERQAPVVHVGRDLNLTVLSEAPKARIVGDGRAAPLDVPVQRLEARDRLPGMEDAA